MERALLTLFGRERRAEVYRGLAASAGVQVSPRGCWLMYRIADEGPITGAALARRLGISTADLGERLTELERGGWVSVADGARPDGAAVGLTAAGQDAAARLDEARQAGIDRLMSGWEPDKDPQLRRLLGQITRNLVATDAPVHQEAASVPASLGG
jgi:DNA-binding MarR family transcriptional regulator